LLLNWEGWHTVFYRSVILNPSTILSLLKVALCAVVLGLSLTACGGGATDPTASSGAQQANSATMPSPETSAARQAEGAAANTQELEDALTDAESLAADTPLAAGETASLAAYKSGQIAQKAASVQLPVYRFYNTLTGTHFYTSSTTERDSVQASLAYMSYEGQAFLAAAQLSAGLKPVYRFYNTQRGVHFYTISTNERDAIQANLPQFQLEGIAYYASQVAGLGLTPLYRFFLPKAGTHFYTVSESERQNVQDKLSASYTFEGVSYYVLTADCALVSGASQLAAPNACYLVNSASPVDIALPPSANLAVGDTLRVSGLGAGGWRIAQNSAQFVQTTLPGAQSGLGWVPRETNREWESVASAADGSKLVAVANADHIYTSIDAGKTWAARESVRNWISVASSADGNKLVAVVGGGQIFVSGDAGVTWTARESSRNWQSVTSSADGSKLAAVVNGGAVYTSSDAGTSWTSQMILRNWASIASDATGNQLVAGVSGGQIYTSLDAGATWTGRDSNRAWSTVASSADGTRLIAGVDGGAIYPSEDAGVTWNARAANRFWSSLASSADGLRLVGTAYSGQIYTSQPSTTPGAGGAMNGATGSAIELRYLGDDAFEVLSVSGSVTAQ
jgi:hypothetical protein